MTKRTLEEISNIVAPIAEMYGIERMYLFGSRARGDNDEDSDYDFSVEPGRIDNMLVFIRFVDDLKAALGSDVDVVSRRGLRKDHFYEMMIADEAVVYG